jgi:hypothetical protein
VGEERELCGMEGDEAPRRMPAAIAAFQRA